MGHSTAVVCECNPIHPGHRTLLHLAKAGADVVLAIMSGNFTQRGTPAVFDKLSRAASVVACGADLVVELPWPWCSSGAEDFARGGATLAAGLGADSMTFGSESGDLSLLCLAAELRASEEFAQRSREADSERRNRGTAAAFDAVMAELGLPDPLGPNDKLGLEYIRFGQAAGIGEFRPVRRNPDAPSAAEVREILFRDGFDAARSRLAEDSEEILRGAAICTEERYAEMLHAHCLFYLREDEPNELLRYAKKAARQTVDPLEFLRLLPTKKYTAARMRRELLRSVLSFGGSPVRADQAPRFTILLAANARGRAYIAGNRGRFGVPLIIKPADRSELDELGQQQFRLHQSADEFYAYLTNRLPDAFMKTHPAIL